MQTRPGQGILVSGSPNTYTEELFVVYLKFLLNWAHCILYGKPIYPHFTDEDTEAQGDYLPKDTQLGGGKASLASFPVLLATVLSCHFKPMLMAKTCKHTHTS